MSYYIYRFSDGKFLLRGHYIIGYQWVSDHRNAYAFPSKIGAEFDISSGETVVSEEEAEIITTMNS